MDATGLAIEIDRKQGETKRTETLWIAAPFEVLGASRDPHGGDWGKVLRWRDDDGRVHVRHVADADLHGEPAALCASLAHHGLRIARARQRDLVGYLSIVRSKRRATIVSRTGWNGIGGQSVFVLPGETIGPRCGENVILDAAARGPYEARGTIEEWRDGRRDARERPCSAGVGNFGRAGRTAVVSCRARRRRRPFLWAIVEGQDDNSSGGCVRMGAGRVTRICKSVARDGERARRRGGVGDGYGPCAGRNERLTRARWRRRIYALANGDGKQRAARDGSLREPKSWRVIFVSSGEVPFETKMSEGKGKARAGQLLRLLDIPADRGLGFGVFDNGGSQDDAGALSRAIKGSASAAYGTAGPEFVRRIIAKSVTGDDVRALVSDFVKAECPAGADGQVERVAHRLGLVAVAGELAITTSVVPWRAGEARQAAAWALRAWLANRGGTQPAEVRQAIQQVRLYIEQHGDSRFDPLDSVEAKPSPNRAGWRKGEGEEREWLIPPETWKAEICAGLDPGFVARTLAERGLIERASDGFQPVRRIGGSNKRVYVLNARIFAGGGYDA